MILDIFRHWLLNALMKDQIRRTEEGNLKAAILSVKRKKITGDLQIDFNDGNLELLKGAKYDILFTCPEAFISRKEGMEVFQSKLYQSSVQVLVIDEAHCILEWCVLQVVSYYGNCYRFYKSEYMHFN